jgi:glutamate dehydrogenase (NAD(P)+)
MKENSYNPFKNAQLQFDSTADLLDLEQAVRDLLRVPMREFQFSIPVRMDDGQVKIFRGFRIQHNDARGPGKGGIRFHPQETIDTVRALAMWMTWKCAVVDIPLGGSGGAVVCDPHDLSLMEQERLCRGWVKQIAKNVGPLSDVPGPDVLTNAQHMLWMMDEFESILGVKAPGFITGKTVGIGGSLGRKEAEGYGLMITVREALKELKINPRNTTASFQGFGNVSQNAIQLYHQMGGTTICVSCWDHAHQKPYSYRKKDGIDLDELLSITDHFGEIKRIEAQELGYELLPGDAWIKQDVSILVPAALENQITSENAPAIQARVKIIAEGTNGPTSPEADKIINDRGILVIPDIVAYAGGVTCSYFEQVQGNMNYYWKKEEILGKLDVQLASVFIEVYEFAKANDLSFRDAAFTIAVKRVAQACRERGWV